jgi:hypothetical protein
MEAKGMNMIRGVNYAREAAVYHISTADMDFFYVIQKIKNPDYKGKWKAPLIDNPSITFLILKIVNITLRVNQLSI